LEKRGIPTITIVTSAFAEMVRSVLKDQEVPGIALVVVEHPIAGHNAEGIRKKADGAFPDILRAATKWQPEPK
jgi:hypothetical protein